MNGIFRLTPFFALLILLVSCTEEPEMKPITPRVMSMRVADTSGLTERAFPGRARAEQEVNQSFRVSGQLIALPVNIGDEVKKGVMPLLQDAFWISMAMTIMAGLTFGTVLTMILVPTFYTTLYRIKSP